MEEVAASHLMSLRTLGSKRAPTTLTTHSASRNFGVTLCRNPHDTRTEVAVSDVSVTTGCGSCDSLKSKTIDVKIINKTPVFVAFSAHDIRPHDGRLRLLAMQRRDADHLRVALRRRRLVVGWRRLWSLHNN